MLELSCRWQSSKLRVALADDATLADLGEAVRVATELEPTCQKLLINGKKLVAEPAATLASLGVVSGAKVMVVGTKKEVLEATSANFRKNEKMAVERADAAQAARLKRYRGARGGEPEPEYRFLELTVLEGPCPDARGRIRRLESPPPSEAMALLKRLATDRGVLAIMAKYKWKVGLLKEFPPADGKVGVDNQCLLGYNKNRGMEIGLRLRTDNLDGLRPFEVIMRTLLHELTHMVHDDHDINFRELCSKLTKERFQLDWTKQGGATAGGGDEGPTELWETEDEMGAVFQGGSGELGGAMSTEDPRELALRAARRRQQEAQSEGQGEDATATGEVVMLESDGAAATLPWETQTPPVETAAVVAEQAPTVDEISMEEVVETEAQAEDEGQPTQSADIHEPAVVSPTPRVEEVQADAPSAQPEAAEAEPPAAPALDVSVVPSTESAPMSEDALSILMSMGFERAQCERALRATGNDTERATNWIFANPEPVEPASEVAPGVGVAGEVGEEVDELARSFEGEGERRVREAVEMITSFNASDEAVRVLRTLKESLNNCVQHPDEQKYRKFNTGKKAFQKHLGTVPGAVELLKAAGFVEEAEGELKLLRLRRNDPGLLWLAISACDAAMQ
jgi:hypothetical protein